MEQRTKLYQAGDSAGIDQLEKQLLAQNAQHKDWACTEEMMKKTKDGKALYLHCLPADITGLSCPEGEVDNSVFDRYLVPLYKQASFKPYVIAAMTVSQKQTVEIVKVLYRGANILILDEPTAVLTPQEIEFLLKIIDGLRKSGKTIILITHKIEEIKKIADRCAILYRGRLVDVLDVRNTTTQAMDRVVLVQGHYRQEFHILPAPYSWRYREELRAATEIGSHFIDLMRYLTGQEVEAVSASFLNATPRRFLRDGMPRVKPDTNAAEVLAWLRAEA